LNGIWKSKSGAILAKSACESGNGPVVITGLPISCPEVWLNWYCCGRKLAGVVVSGPLTL
jgi:hypothetical protein